MTKIQRVIGIDLGTTNSCVATVVGGTPQVIPNAQGYKTTPSVVAFLEEDKILVGQHAKRQAIINPSQTVCSIKRLIGRKWSASETKKARSVYPYTLEDGPDGAVFVRLGDKQLSVSEVSAEILKEMKRVAQQFLAEEVNDAVITVPAYFNDRQRQDTKKAGELAGLNVLRIINEPTAAALAYGHAQKARATIAVYDLGGGTFDLSVLEIRDGVFKVLATAGDTFLGGDDFDNALIDFFAERVVNEIGIDIRADSTSLQRLKDGCEQLKCELSIVKETKLALPFVGEKDGQPVHLEMAMSRKELEALVKPIIERTLRICKQVVDEAGLSKGDIDDVLLVGGQTRMPKIQDVVSNFFGRSASKQIHPDEAVAVGAAIHASSLLQQGSGTLLLDVTPMALGIRTAGNTYNQIILKNSTVPISKSHTFTTVADNQQSVKIQVFQGDYPVASDNELMGEFLLAGIRKAKAGEPEIEVEFSIDANGIVQVSAKDLDTGQEQSITLATESAEDIDPSDDREEFEIRLSQQSQADEIRQDVQLSLYQLRKRYESGGAYINNESQKRILKILDLGPGILKSEDVEQIGKLKREIRKAMQFMD